MVPAKGGRDGGLDGTLEQERADKGRVALRGDVATAPAAARRLQAREEEEVLSEPPLGYQWSDFRKSNY